LRRGPCAQDELYRRAGVSELVAAVTQGVHATILAYGQTGAAQALRPRRARLLRSRHVCAPLRPPSCAAARSAAAAGSGKTHTMEGYKYVAPSSQPRKAGGAPGAGPALLEPPAADFEGTPEAQLGVVPRAVRELFTIIRRHGASRRYRVTYGPRAPLFLSPAALSPLSSAIRTCGANRLR
jgi:hypothetical protein